MFGKRKFNSFFGDFDSMFNELNSMFNDNQFYVTGKRKVENGTDNNGEWTKESFISDDGTYSVTTIVRSNSLQSKSTRTDDKVESLKIELEKLVESQEFEKAVELRDRIKNLEVNQDKINKLKSELEESIKKQDFETSIKLRDEIKKLEE